MIGRAVFSEPTTRSLSEENVDNTHAKMTPRVNIGIMGAGIVGAGTIDVLSRKSDFFKRTLACELIVKKVLVRSLDKQRSATIPEDILTTEPSDILDDAEIQIVVEVMGGEEPAHQYICEALQRGKHVVSANKEVVAKHGPRLLQLANKHMVDLLFEASVGGGIPVIVTLRDDLIANEITSIQAIINGTTNFILTAMSQGRDYGEALREAQELGYAEADPTNDVEGIDAAYKLAILSSLAFKTAVTPEDIRRIGITNLHPKDFKYAEEMGYSIKLLATAYRKDGKLELAVRPAFLLKDHHLASVKGAFNAILIDGDQLDNLMLYGQGAGAKPTASAVVADICASVNNITRGVTERLALDDQQLEKVEFGDTESRFYVRLQVADQAGVLAQISEILGRNEISIASVIQKETDEAARIAEIVVMSHSAVERQMETAMDQVAGLEVVREISAFIRVAR